MKKKILTLLLCAAMLSGSFTGCSESADSNPHDAPASSEVTDSSRETPAAEETEAEEENLFPKLEHTTAFTDYGGYEFGILTRGMDIYLKEMDADEMTGETVNDAIVTRNLTVEDQFNIKISAFSNATGDGHGPNGVENLIMAGDKSMDMIVGSCYGMMPKTVNGLFYNLNSLENLDLDALCWSQGIRETSTIAGKSYVASGSIALYYFKKSYALLLNRNLCTDFGINVDDIYTQVIDGKWTMDAMIGLTEDLYIDTNGDGNPDGDDIYGCGILLNCMNDGWWSACELPILTKNAEGLVQFDVNIEKLDSVNEKLRNYVWNSGGVLPMSEDVIHSREITANGTNNPFYKDKLCLTTMRLEFTETQEMREMESDFGVVPYPKYDETQQQYHSYLHDAFSLVLIPNSCTDPEMTAAIMQTMAVESHNTVMPAYYEVVLTNKYMRDRQSVTMLDIIFQNVVFDTGWLFSDYISYLPQTILREEVWKNINTLESTIKSRQKALNKLVDILNTKYQENP